MTAPAPTRRPLAHPRPGRGPHRSGRCASTGVKEPAYPDTRYVVDLVTSGVVNTMPGATLRAMADHGVLRGDTVIPGYHDAAEVMAALAEIGVDHDDVVDKLERDGLATFQASWAALAEIRGAQPRGRQAGRCSVGRSGRTAEPRGGRWLRRWLSTYHVAANGYISPATRARAHRSR